MNFKVIIAGGRDFTDLTLLDKKAFQILYNIDKEVEIVSGGARGADKTGEEWACINGYKLKIFEADWEKHGRSAGYIRNSEMADYSDALIAFWDGKSRGTKNMIDTAKKKGLKVRIIRYEL